MYGFVITAKSAQKVIEVFKTPHCGKAEPFGDDSNHQVSDYITTHRTFLHKFLFTMRSHYLLHILEYIQ